MRIKTSISKNQRFLITLSFSAALILLSFLFITSHVRAESFSWTSGAFQFGEESLVGDSPQDCTNKSVRIGGQFSSTIASVCVYERPHWRYGFYNSNGQSALVVGIGSDTAMYKVINPGYGYQHEVINVPGTDDFVYNRLTAGFTNNHNVMIARDFQSKLQRSQSGAEIVYTLREGSYEPLIHDDSGNPITTGAVGVSENGRWIAVEAMSTGFILMNTQSEELSLFSNYRHSYGYGSDAHITFVISDDGRHVAAFDYNIQPKVYTLSDYCAIKRSSYTEIATESSSYQSCPDDGGQLSSVLNQKFGSTEARSKAAEGFSYDGDVLYFSRVEWSADLKPTKYRIPLQAGYYQPPEDLKYLALGDSYSSGEGDTVKNPNSAKYYREYTDNEENRDLGIPREKCHISTRSYPYLLAQGMQLTGTGSQKQWDTAACSGAQIFDVNSKYSNSYLGQGKGGGEKGVPRLEGYDNAQDLKTIALNEFIPGRQKQVEFVKKYKPKAITLTIGGNDIGFGDKITTCVMPSVLNPTCDIATEQGRSKLGKQIRDQYDKLKALYEELYKASGSTAKIYVLGYPQFVNANEDASCDLNVQFV